MILVLGASSQIGYYLAQQLSHQSLTAMAVSRQPPPAWGMHPNICWVQWDLDQQPLESDAIHLIGAGALRHVVAVAKTMPRLQHVVAFSSSSVVTKETSGSRAEQRIVEELKNGERTLRAVCSARGITLTLFRPTLIYGCGLDKSLTRVANWLKRRSWLPLAYPASGLRQPVHAEDLARLCLRCLELGADANGCYSLAGATRLTYLEMVQQVALAIDIPLKSLFLPARLLGFTLNLAARVLPGLSGLNGEMVRRQNLDLLVDDEQARVKLGWDPRPFYLEPQNLQPPV